MHISRFVSLVTKPLLSSFSPRVAPVVWAPCRAITTDQAHVRFGKGSGEMPQHKDLDVLLGRWRYDPDNPQGDKIDPKVRALIPQGHYINIARNNGTWNFETGVKGFGRAITYKFKLNTSFETKHGSMVYRGMAQKFGNNGLGITLRNQFDDITIMRFTAEVVEDKLFMRTETIVGSPTKKVYIRE